MAEWLLALTGPIVRRVLLSLGVGLVVYTGLDMLISQLIGLINSNLGAFTSDVASLVALSGFLDALGIIFGALTTRLSFVQMKAWDIK